MPAVATTQYPYDTIVRVLSTSGGVTFQASGVLISPDEVLTASHVVYTSGIGTSQNIVVTPGYEFGAQPYGTSNATSVHYNQIQDGNDQISLFNSQLDFAVIHLATSFLSNGTMGLLANFAGGAVDVAGYPAAAYGGLIDSTETVTKDPVYSLLDGTALGPGSSGGPVFVGGASNPQIVGVVSSEGGNGVGYFTQFTTADVNEIKAWVAADDGPGNTTSAYRASAATVAADFNAFEALTAAGKLTSITLTDGGTPAIQLSLAQLLGDKDVLRFIGGQYTIVVSGSTIRGSGAALIADRFGSNSSVLDVRFVDGDLSYDPNGAAAQITRLYQAALNRAPDQAGLHDWIRQLGTGTTLGTVAAGFVSSAEFASRFGTNLDNTGYITALYANVLHRTPDSGGLAAWTGQLASGAARSDILVDFSESAENRSNTAAAAGAGIWNVDTNGPQVARLYDTVFGRLPDVGGLASWEGQLDSGAMSLDQVAASFTASAEFVATYGTLSPAAFVTALYANTLHRAPDATGLAGWLGQLNAGASRSSVVLGFSESAEHQALTAANILSNDPASYGIKTA